jgi:hypothetical protein
MQRQELNIIFREVKHGDFKGEIDCVFLDFKEDHYGHRVACYAHVGQHSSGDYSYFLHCTKTTTPEKYQSLFNEIKSIYNDYNIVIHSKLTKKYLK